MKKTFLLSALFLTFGLQAKICEGFGPQTSRDITSKKGTNPVVFSFAPSYEQMNLCNIHFHKNAEHKAKDFSIFAGNGTKGIGGGYQCNANMSITFVFWKKNALVVLGEQDVQGLRFRILSQTV